MRPAAHSSNLLDAELPDDQANVVRSSDVLVSRTSSTNWVHRRTDLRSKIRAAKVDSAELCLQSRIQNGWLFLKEAAGVRWHVVGLLVAGLLGSLRSLLAFFWPPAANEPLISGLPDWIVAVVAYLAFLLYWAATHGGELRARTLSALTVDLLEPKEYIADDCGVYHLYRARLTNTGGPGNFEPKIVSATRTTDGTAAIELLPISLRFTDGHHAVKFLRRGESALFDLIAIPVYAPNGAGSDFAKFGSPYWPQAVGIHEAVLGLEPVRFRVQIFGDTEADNPSMNLIYEARDQHSFQVKML